MTCTRSRKRVHVMLHARSLGEHRYEKRGQPPRVKCLQTCSFNPHPLREAGATWIAASMAMANLKRVTKSAVRCTRLRSRGGRRVLSAPFG